MSFRSSATHLFLIAGCTLGFLILGTISFSAKQPSAPNEGRSVRDYQPKDKAPTKSRGGQIRGLSAAVVGGEGNEVHGYVKTTLGGSEIYLPDTQVRLENSVTLQSVAVNTGPVVLGNGDFDRPSIVVIP